MKKAASGVPCLRRSASRRQVAILSYSRTESTLRASTTGAPYGTQQAILRPCWTDFFEHSLQLMMAISSWACICHGIEIFTSPMVLLIASGTDSDQPAKIPLPYFCAPKHGEEGTQSQIRAKGNVLAFLHDLQSQEPDPDHRTDHRRNH